MKALDNLVSINKLKTEAPNAKEFAGMLQAGDRKLLDAQIEGLSDDSQFAFLWCSACFFFGSFMLAWLSF